MDRILEPFVNGGAFDGIVIPRSRLIGQTIDNLNKAAAVGFPVEEIATRLRSAWEGESSRLQIYDQVQAVALAFRRACLAENLLDWSLQIEVFWHQLLPLPQVRRYLLSGYRHILADNTEEDIPAAHDLLRIWLPQCESALVINDTDGGYRVFLGADPEGGLALANLCRERVVVSESYVTSTPIALLGAELVAPFTSSASQQLAPAPSHTTNQSSDHAPGMPDGQPGEGNAREALVVPPGQIRFHPQMLDWVVQQVSRLVLDEGLPPGQIAILAPFLSDSLRFTLGERLADQGIPLRTHRPSRQLHEEPAARCLLTLAKLAHPVWRRPPPVPDVAHALAFAIDELDPVRARLLADIVYRVQDGRPTLSAFHQIIPETQIRISYLLGGRYDELRRWLDDYVDRITQDSAIEGLDHFLSRLFGELLSQVGFGFHRDFDAGAVAANLIESIQKFRQGFSSGWTAESASEGSLAIEYVDMVERGVVAAQYLSSWRTYPEDALLLVPAYTFLMMNRPVTVQFWLDVNSQNWVERIYQPLTHPYVLRRDWPEDKQWTDADEVEVTEAALARLILGLTRRCRQRIYLAYSELNERGYEQQGLLLQAVQHLLRQFEGTRP
jgi:hypothetical protein